MEWKAIIGRLRDGRFSVGTRFLRIIRTNVLWTESARHRKIQLKNWASAQKQTLMDGDLLRWKAFARSRQLRCRRF